MAKKHNKERRITMIQEAYVSFEVAELLKEKGFDWKCEYCYDVANDNPFSNANYQVSYPKPTHQMAMAWLREVHNIHVELNPICYGDTEEDLRWYYGWAVKTTIFTDRWKRHNAEHISYEQACEAALKYVLENLI